MSNVVRKSLQFWNLLAGDLVDKASVFLPILVVQNFETFQSNPGDLPCGEPCSPHGSTLCLSPGQPARIPGDCQLSFQTTKRCQGWLMVLMASDVGLFLGARTSSRCYLHKYVLYHSYPTVDPSGKGVLHPPFMFFQALVTSMADHLRHSHPLHLHPCTPCRCRCCHRCPALQVSCLDFPLPATVVRHIIFRSSDLLGGNNRSEGINGMLPKDANIQQEVEDAMHEVSNYEFDNMDEEEVRKVISTATLVLLPIFYIYTWLCARSLYLELSIGEVEPSPGQRRPPG